MSSSDSSEELSELDILPPKPRVKKIIETQKRRTKKPKTNILQETKTRFLNCHHSLSALHQEYQNAYPFIGNATEKRKRKIKNIESTPLALYIDASLMNIDVIYESCQFHAIVSTIDAILEDLKSKGDAFESYFISINNLIYSKAFDWRNVVELSKEYIPESVLKNAEMRMMEILGK